MVGGKPFVWAELRIKPDVVDWDNDGDFDLLLAEERGKVLLLLNTGTKTEHRFDEALPLKDGDRELKVWLRGDPCIADWNGDGKKDLLVADEGGKVSFFPNRGTDESPVFDGSKKVRAKGWPLCPGTSSYFRLDMDGDGKEETVAANNDGLVVLYRSRKYESLAFGGEVFKSEHGRPGVQKVDWNDDGLPDILIAEKSGTVRVAINTGSGKSAEFATLTTLTVGDTPLNGGKGTSPRFEDADGDGIRDLVCFDRDFKVKVFRNKGTNQAPVLEAIELPEKDSSEVCCGYRSRLDIIDWNNDGALDLVYGVTSYKDRRCRVYVFLRPK